MNRSLFYISLWLSLLLSVFPLSVNSHAEGGWEWVNPLPTGSLLNAVTWGDGQFLAVGMLGTVVTSPEGEHWNSQTSGVLDDLYGVTTGASRFVAVGGRWPSGPIIITSEDGVIWRSQYPSVSDSWAELNDVAWNGNIFLAVGGGAGWPLVFTSPDGDNWTQQEIGLYADLYGITWDGSRFVSVGEYTGTTSLPRARVFISTDGVDWTINPAPYEELRDISWSPELQLFSAIGVDGNESAVLT